MATTAEMIKELRQLTGAGVLDCKKALDQTAGDMDKAAQILRAKGLAAAAKKTEREALDGRVEVYVHPGSKLAAMVEVSCETDFVARTEAFQTFCHDLAMQIAAANPSYVSQQDIPADVLEAEKAKYRAQLAAEQKPEAMIAHIIEGKLAKFYQEKCLLDQAFIKDEEKTIQQLMMSVIAKLGENVVIRRFARFQIG